MLALTIYLFSDGSGYSDGSGDTDGFGDSFGSGDLDGSGDSGGTDEFGKSTKLAQFWFKIYKIRSKVFSQLNNNYQTKTNWKGL